MTNPSTHRQLSHDAVQQALAALARTGLKPQTESLLRVYLAFRAVHRAGSVSPSEVSAALKARVEEIFVALPTPGDVEDARYDGTVRLRGTDGHLSWMKNDSYRGAFQNYVGPSSNGRHLFSGADYTKPLRTDAAKRVIDSLVGNTTGSPPPRDALAALALKNEPLDPTLGWVEVCDLARQRFGLTANEWIELTSEPSIDIGPFDGAPWDPEALSEELRPPGMEKAAEAESEIDNLSPELQSQVERVVQALEKFGHRRIIALAGVPATSKSHVARIAARAFASENSIKEVQFSPGYTYEQFIEGPRYGKELAVEVAPGSFLELNSQALEEPGKRFVLLIEELSRADLTRVLGELLTYVEYRKPDDEFHTMYEREAKRRIAPNIAVLATYNPTDSSAVGVDAAISRRLRTLTFPPDVGMLREILGENGLDTQVIAQLEAMFNACSQAAGPDRFEMVMPFGHAVFSDIEDEEGLHDLWHEELKHIVQRSRGTRHELHDVIREHYPWADDPEHSVVVAAPAQNLTDSDPVLPSSTPGALPE